MDGSLIRKFSLSYDILFSTCFKWLIVCESINEGGKLRLIDSIRCVKLPTFIEKKH